MEKELQYLKRFFEFVNMKKFSEEFSDFGINYYHLTRILSEERKLTPKYFERINKAIKSFCEKIVITI